MRSWFMWGDQNRGAAQLRINLTNTSDNRDCGAATLYNSVTNDQRECSGDIAQSSAPLVISVGSKCDQHLWYTSSGLDLPPCMWLTLANWWTAMCLIGNCVHYMYEVIIIVSPARSSLLVWRQLIQSPLPILNPIQTNMWMWSRRIESQVTLRLTDFRPTSQFPVPPFLLLYSVQILQIIFPHTRLFPKLSTTLLV